MTGNTLPNSETPPLAETRDQHALSLGERLDVLFRRVRQADGKKYTNQQAGDFIGYDRGYISALRTGAKANPRREVLQGLADFFDVSPAYFFDDEKSREIAEQIDVAVSLRDPATRAVAVQLLRETEPADVPLVADVVRAVTERPELREVLELMLSLNAADVRLAGEVLRSVVNRDLAPKD